MKPVDANHIYRDGRHYDLQYKDFAQDIPFLRRQARKYGGPIDILSRDPTKRYPYATYPDPNGKGVVEITENNIYDDATQINRIKLYYKIGDQKEKVDELNMRIFYPQEIDALLKYNGFAIERKFGDYDENFFKSGSSKQIVICYRA